MVLYELLTGHRPYRLRSRVIHEVARVICEEEPTRPSTVISEVEKVSGRDGETTLTPEQVSEVREGKPSRLKKRLSGDLDAILLMTLRKEPNRRYSSVEQFAEDLARHLQGLPVRAHVGTLRYRAAKFYRRHWPRLILAAGVLIAVVLTASSLWRAHEERSRAAALEDQLDLVNRLYGFPRRTTTKLTRDIPNGWQSNGGRADQFAIAIDRSVLHSGRPSLLVASSIGGRRDSDGLAQAIRADDYRGKRVRWSASIRCQDVAGTASLWMRVNAADRILAFDNMSTKHISGTRDWQEHAVVLDIPPDTSVINFGLILLGKGLAWFSDLKFEAVRPEVAPTDLWPWLSPAYKREADLALQRYSGGKEWSDRLPTQPVNLSLE